MYFNSINTYIEYKLLFFIYFTFILNINYIIFIYFTFILNINYIIFIDIIK